MLFLIAFNTKSFLLHIMYYNGFKYLLRRGYHCNINKNTNQLIRDFLYKVLIFLLNIYFMP